MLEGGGRREDPVGSRGASSSEDAFHCVSFVPRDGVIIALRASEMNSTNPKDDLLVAPWLDGVVGEQEDAAFAVSDNVDLLPSAFQRNEEVEDPGQR